MRTNDDGLIALVLTASLQVKAVAYALPIVEPDERLVDRMVADVTSRLAVRPLRRRAK